MEVIKSYARLSLLKLLSIRCKELDKLIFSKKFQILSSMYSFLAILFPWIYEFHD